MITFDGQNSIADGSLDRRFFADVLIIVVPYIEAFAVQVDIECPSCELATFENLPECVAVDKNLLAPADE